MLARQNPKRCTVIDYRALEALGTETPDRSVSFYLCFPRYCRAAAARFGISLRTLGRALFQWSLERTKAK
jgi:hypothetical protein